MEQEMNKKTENAMDTILTMAGAACLMYPLIKQATKTLAPELEKLTSGAPVDIMKMLPSGQEKPEESEKPEREEERKPHEDKVAKLERELAEYKAKEKGQYE